MRNQENPFGLVIEGGGSHTSVAYFEGGELAFELHGSVSNPRSVPEQKAADALRSLLLEAKGQVEGKLPVYAAHGAASTKKEAEALGNRVEQILGRESLTQVVVVNDLVPVVLSVPEGSSSFVAAAGTGTGFMARSSSGKWGRASGHEFVLTDEGGGYELGQQILRAAFKDIDNRGESTLLTDLIMDRVKCSRGELQEKLFENIYRHSADVKFKVATFADLVFVAEAQNDEVAGKFLENAANEIILGIKALERSLGHPEGKNSLALTGSLLTEQESLRNRIIAKLDSQFNVSILNSMSLLQTAAQLLRLDERGLNEIGASGKIPLYSWREEKT